MGAGLTQLVAQFPRLGHGYAAIIGNQHGGAGLGQLGQFGIRAGNDSGMMASGFETQYAQAADALLGSTGREAFDAVKMLKEANPAAYTPANGAEYPRSGFGEAMKQIAQLVKADVGLEIAFAESGNWDHHVNEGAANGQIGTRLDDLARSVAALVRDLEPDQAREGGRHDAVPRPHGAPAPLRQEYGGQEHAEDHLGIGREDPQEVFEDIVVGRVPVDGPEDLEIHSLQGRGRSGSSPRCRFPARRRPPASRPILSS